MNFYSAIKEKPAGVWLVKKVTFISTKIDL